jgi:hypothetical protein
MALPLLNVEVGRKMLVPAMLNSAKEDKRSKQRI